MLLSCALILCSSDANFYLIALIYSSLGGRTYFFLCIVLPLRNFNLGRFCNIVYLSYSVRISIIKDCNEGILNKESNNRLSIYLIMMEIPEYIIELP